MFLISLVYFRSWRIFLMNHIIIKNKNKINIYINEKGELLNVLS